MHSKMETVTKVPTAKKSRGKQCSVYGCFNFAFLQNGTPSGLHFFHIPKAVLNDKKQKDRWCSQIKRHDGRDGFSMNNNTVICQEHFRKEDITVSLVTKKWTLNQGVEPTIFDWSSKKKYVKISKKEVSIHITSCQSGKTGHDR